MTALRKSITDSLRVVSAPLSDFAAIDLTVEMTSLVGIDSNDTGKMKPEVLPPVPETPVEPPIVAPPTDGLPPVVPPVLPPGYYTVEYLMDKYTFRTMYRAVRKRKLAGRSNLSERELAMILHAVGWDGD